MTSFSQQVKRELCDVRQGCRFCEEALLYGMLLFTRSLSTDSIVFNTESRAAAQRFTRVCVDRFNVIVNITEPDFRQRSSRPIYSVSLLDGGDSHRILRHFFPDGVDMAFRQAERLPDLSFLQNDCCLLSFLRGAFLACGTVSSPDKEYHFEFSMESESLCNELAQILEGFDLQFRQTSRQKNSSRRTLVLYLKESEQIEDILSRLGAVRASMALMNSKIEKGLRNQVNRVINCETANIGKTVNAAMDQIGKIEYVRDHLGFDSLPTVLHDAARLRLDNPELSLRELCELNSPPLTRSGLNHRLQRLCEMADELRKTGK